MHTCISTSFQASVSSCSTRGFLFFFIIREVCTALSRDFEFSSSSSIIMCCNPTTMTSPKPKPMNPHAPSFYLETSKLPHLLYHHQVPFGIPPSLRLGPASPQYVQSSTPLYLQPFFFSKLPYMYYHYNIQSQPHSFYPQVHPPLPHATVGDCSVAAVCGGAAKAVDNECLMKRVMGIKRFDRTRFMRVGPRREPIVSCNGKTRTYTHEWRQKNTKSKSREGTKVNVSGGVRTAAPSLPPAPISSPSSVDDVSLCGKTTVMIKNIPNQYRRNMLLDFLDKHCQEQNQNAELQSDQLHLAYNFVYLPMDFRTGDNLGYAFVNFTNPAAAMKFREMFDKYRWGVFKTNDSNVYESKKICRITWARIQGQAELIKHFKNSEFPCKNIEYLPIAFSLVKNGSTSFTLPTTVGKCLVSAPGIFEELDSYAAPFVSQNSL